MKVPGPGCAHPRQPSQERWFLSQQGDLRGEIAAAHVCIHRASTCQNSYLPLPGTLQTDTTLAQQATAVLPTCTAVYLHLSLSHLAKLQNMKFPISHIGESHVSYRCAQARLGSRFGYREILARGTWSSQIHLSEPQFPPSVKWRKILSARTWDVRRAGRGVVLKHILLPNCPNLPKPSQMLKEESNSISSSLQQS